MRTHTHTLLGVYMQGFLKTWSKTNIFLSSLHLLFSTMSIISVVCTCLFVSTSYSSFMFVCLSRSSMKMSYDKRVGVCLFVRVHMQSLVCVDVKHPMWFYFWQAKRRCVLLLDNSASQSLSCLPLCLIVRMDAFLMVGVGEAEQSWRTGADVGGRTDTLPLLNSS